MQKTAREKRKILQSHSGDTLLNPIKLRQRERYRGGERERRGETA